MQPQEQPEQRLHPEASQVEKTPKKPGAQPFSEHVKELRLRLLYAVGTLFLGSITGYVLHEPLFRLIKQPLNEQLYYTTPTGGFNAIIKISILFGVIVTVPVVVYQIGKFLSPAFKRRMQATRIIFSSIILAALGVLFAYYLSLPASLHFLANIGDENLQSLLTVNEYLNFVFAYVVGFALLFQLPLIMLFINRIKPQRPGGLMRIQRYVVLLSFVLAAILTPTPDPMNQLIMALPIILLYQFSVGLIWFVNRKEEYIVVEEPVAIEPASYSQTAYSAPVPFPAPQPPAPRPVVAKKPQLISDIFLVPKKI